LRSRRHGRLLVYTVGVVLVVAASLVQLALRPVLPADQTLLFYPAVYGAARLAGRGPGLVATVLSALSIAYFFIPPSFSFAIYDPADQLDLAIFVLLSFVLVVNVAGLDDARVAAEDASARLDEQRAVLEAVVEHAPVGLLFATTDGVVRYENESFRNIGDGGTTRVEKLSDLAAGHGLCWKDGRPVSPDEWRDLLERATEHLVEFEGQWVTPSGRTVWLINRFTPVRSGGRDGRRVGIVAIVRDATAEHAITQLREEVTSIIAHDLRNPIATISISLHQALHDRGRRRFVRVPSSAFERISRSAKRLDGMVGELLDAARVDQGLRIERDTVDIRALVAELVDDLRPSLRGHDVRLDVPEHAVTACVDRLRITQVFTNLLDNASKFSPPQAPIRAELRPSDGGVEVSVADQGEGIAPEDVHRLFDRFFQTRKARSRAGGLGLGLYISKGIVDAHGGRLSVESAPGAGSTFHVWLPTHAPPVSPA
jgi:signal transduction histidine kinase